MPLQIHKHQRNIKVVISIHYNSHFHHEILLLKVLFTVEIFWEG